MKELWIILLLSASVLRAETIEDLLRLAEENNPTIAAARRQRDAARERVAVASALPDPRISYGYFLEEIQTRTGPQEQRAGISQMIPLFGKRALGEQAAAHSAAALDARSRAVRADILFQLKKTWVDLYYLGRALEAERARRQLFQNLEKTAERAVENGGDARDLLDVRITLTQIEDRLQTLEARRVPLLAELNALLNRDEKTPVPFPAALPPAAPVDEPETQSAARERSPAVEEQRALLAREQAKQSLAKRSRIPDITLGADWIQTGKGGDDPVIANISINLPIWFQKNRAEQLGAAFERAAQDFRLQEQINRIQTLLTDAFTKRNDAARRAAFYENALIPPARQHFDLTRIAYENGAADLRDLTASEERLLHLRLMLERARADRAVADAEIENLTGGPSE